MTDDATTPVTASTVLPARRERVTLHTADGVELVAEIARPADREPVASVVCLHPLTTDGGSMDAHLLRKASWRLPALAGVAVLRVNLRGARSAHGASGGEFGAGESECHDVVAAIEWADFADLPAPWLLGWSYGADLALRYGADPSVCGAILLAPPLRFAGDADLDRWARSGHPLVAVVPEHDTYLRPDAARARFARVPQAEVVALAGAKHLFLGHTEAVLDEVVRRVAPDAHPLPRSVRSPA